MEDLKATTENQDRPRIIVPERFFSSTENFGDKLRIQTLYEKYLEENVRKIHERILSNLDITTFEINERREFRELIAEVIYKLGSVIYHFYQFRQLYLETEQIVHNSKSSLPKFKRLHFDIPRLGYEVESLFFQLKCTLDILTKFLRPIFKINASLRSFGEKGNKVIKALENNLSEKSSKRVRIGAENLIGLIRQSQTEGYDSEGEYGWLQMMIDMRDDLAHSQKSNVFFIIDQDETGNVTIHPPKITQHQTHLQGLEVLVHNAVRFVEDFVIHSFGCRLKPEYRIWIVEQRKYDKDWVWCNGYDWILSGGKPLISIEALKRMGVFPKEAVVERVIKDNYLLNPVPWRK